MTKSLILGVMLALAACSESDFDDEFSFERINPESLNEHPFYSQVTTVSGDAKFVYVAGQTDRAVDYRIGSNECRHADWRGQVIGVTENVGLALSAAGAGWDDVVFIRRFVLDMAAYRSALTAADDPLPVVWQDRAPPPSTLIEVGALSEPCQLLEVDVFAVVPAEE
jgi:enamine deaminase RidA (YjgF/YER057c/UK114 family)